jgi:sec-independent protein translocase protein TatA
VDILGPWHLLIVAAIFVMMFGAKRLPEAARSLGKSARILKTELKDLHHEEVRPETPAAAVAITPPAPVQQVQQDHPVQQVHPVAGPVVQPVVDLNATPVSHPR